MTCRLACLSFRQMPVCAAYSLLMRQKRQKKFVVSCHKRHSFAYICQNRNIKNLIIMKFKLYLFLAFIASIPLIACGCSNKNMAVENTGIKLHDNFKDSDSGIIKKTLPLKDFHGINVESSVGVYYTQGSEYKVVFEGSENAWKALCFDVQEQTLVVKSSKKPHDDGNKSGLYKLYVTAPDIDRLSCSGFFYFHAKSMKTGSLTVNNKGALNLDIENLKADSYNIVNKGFITNNGRFEVGKFDVQNYAAYSCRSDLKVLGDMNVSNKGSVYLCGSIEANKIFWNCRGADNCELAIKAKNVDFNISGSGVINGKFKGDGMSIKCNGAAKVNMDVDCLSVTASVNGSGNIALSGTADKIDIGGSGISRIDTSRLNNFE